MVQLKIKSSFSGSRLYTGLRNDFGETFTPIITPTTPRDILSNFLSNAIINKWSIHQLNVKNAFLNGFS